MRLFQSVLFGSIVLAVLAPEGGAHFRLIEPASWLQESQIGTAVSTSGTVSYGPKSETFDQR